MSFAGYVAERTERVARAMGASRVEYDLLGITLTIDGKALLIPDDAVRAMSALLHEAETEAVDRLRREMAAERGPF